MDLGERPGALYASSDEALKAVKDDFLYWTGTLTDSSFELSLALIAANWAVFGSVQRILSNPRAKTSLGLIIATLAISLAGAKYVGELHDRRVKYAAQDVDRWEKECAAAYGTTSPWPFTIKIERLGRCLREVKTWLPLLAGILFLVALFKG
jgi:hypothetical protein